MTSSEVRIGSLFSGVGGLELGLEHAIPSAHTVWQVEQDPYARAVLARHWPHASREVTDVRRAGRHTLEPVDLICGGFPCQDISVAGKGAGLDGERSGLWTEYARILRELRPRFVVVENVPALLARGMGRVLGDLASLGYDAEWSVLAAAEVGAPHLRRRLFIIAYLPHANGQRVRQQPELEPRVGGEALAAGDGTSWTVAVAHGEGQLQPGQLLAEGGRRPGRRRLEGGALDPGRRPPQPRLGGVADGLPHWLDPDGGLARTAEGVLHRGARLRCLGNAVVPRCAYEVGLRLLHLAHGPPHPRLGADELGVASVGRAHCARGPVTRGET